MQIVVVHGVPGVGKRTVCEELRRLTGFPFLNFHHLAVLLGPVFGFSSPEFSRLRDSIYDELVEAATRQHLSGLITTCIFEPSVRVERFLAHRERARALGGELTFVGLRCDDTELERRMTAPDRPGLGKWDDFPALRETMRSGYFDVPPLPDPSLSIDTTDLSPDETALAIQSALLLQPNPKPSTLNPG